MIFTLSFKLFSLLDNDLKEDRGAYKSTTDDKDLLAFWLCRETVNSCQHTLANKKNLKMRFARWCHVQVDRAIVPLLICNTIMSPSDPILSQKLARPRLPLTCKLTTTESLSFVKILKHAWNRTIINADHSRLIQSI